MKKMYNLKQLLLLVAVAIGFAACDKKDDPDPEPAPAEVISISIEDLKKLSTATSVTIPDGRKIKGIVISDAASKNIDAESIVLQEAADKPGIIVNFDAGHSFALGDEVEIDISKQALEQVNGEIALQHIPVAGAAKKGTGSITARETTTADIMANKTAWNGTLVSITATELTSTDGKYKGNLTVKDASGSLASAVMAGAAFENEDLATSISKLTGIVRIDGNEVRVDLRNKTDVVLGAVTRSIAIDFSGLTDSTGAAVDFTSFSEIRAFRNIGGKTVPDVGVWGASINGYQKPMVFQNMVGDEALTNRNPYFYLNINNQVLGLSSTGLQGLRTVTVTFAYSKAVQVYGNTGSWIATGAFDPSRDKIQISISTVYTNVSSRNTLYFVAERREGGAGALVDALEQRSPEYTETGKDYTFSYTMPTEAEAKAAGGFDGDVQQYLLYPSFVIRNRSTVSGATFYPVIIKKVVLGFSE